MWEMSSGLLPVTVVELFHTVKNDKKFYTIMNKKINKLADRRILMSYEVTVPILKESLARLRSERMVSEPRLRKERWW